MQRKDGERFAACLMAVADVYGKAMSEAVVGVWYRTLEPYDIKAIEDAFDRHVRSPDQGQYMAKPADIVKMLDGSSEDASLVAWTKVDRAVRQVGAYQSVAFDDAIIHRVLHDMGGWIGLGTKTEDEWPFIANEFRNRYRGYRLQGAWPDHPAHLMGITEAENTRKAQPNVVIPLVYIGDAVKAQAVQAGGTQKPMLGFTTASAALANDPTMRPRPPGGKPRLETVQ